MEETQTPESQKNETSSEQEMNYHGDPNQMDDWQLMAADNNYFESVGLPQKQQKTEEDECFILVPLDDVASKTYLSL